jgi:6-phosphogluconolactonase (cycloisomerase 2 family)
LINDFAVSGIQDGLLFGASGSEPTTTQPQVIAVTQDGTELYVGINVGTGIEAFTIDGTGAFTALDAEATGGVIHDIVLRESRD